MFIDARRLPRGQSLSVDVCIIGAGAAGITLARELAGKSVDVMLLESGGLERDEETQELCAGKIVGQPYHPLVTTRLRLFGGTTMHWVGACRPLDPIDFEKRDWIPHSGWPFDREAMNPFYERAQRVCELGPLDYDVETWNHGGPWMLPFASDVVSSTVFQFSPPTKFGIVYRDEVASAPNIRTLLWANVVELETAPNSKTVTRARVATLEGNELHVSARLFVLAAGALENARILLLSTGSQEAGLGNEHDLVGRFFMEHPHIYSGVILPVDESLFMPFYRTRRVRDTRIRGALRLSETTVRREQLLGFGTFLRPTFVPGAESLEYITDAIRRGQAPKNLLYHLKRVVLDIGDIAESRCREMLGTTRSAIALHNRSEQSPNRDSRVRLGEERDSLNRRVTVLDWRLNEIDKRSLRRAHELMGIELGRAGLGRLRVELDESPEWPSNLSGGSHHMGTTRMHVDPKQGVVDPDCRVHGVSNLFISGSSVFPTVGYSNPTLTIVALALRLSDHIKRELGLL